MNCENCLKEGLFIADLAHPMRTLAAALSRVWRLALEKLGQLE